MSLYHRYAKGDVKKSDFKLTTDNIMFYKDLCKTMHNEISWAKSYCSIVNKINDPNQQDDYLFTPEYLERRLNKLKADREIDDSMQTYLNTLQEFNEVEDKCKLQFREAMDKEKGKSVEVQEEMSRLNDLRKSLEDKIDQIYSDRYGKLKTNLPKIYYSILEGVDMTTVSRCFQRMYDVLTENMDIESATEDLLNDSQQRFNLPPEVYSSIRQKIKKPKNKGK